ncbi:MAG: PmoA family protein, partial [Isosphaeraceae bacterium]
ESEIKIVEKQGRVTAQVGGKEVWTYQRANALHPAGIDPVYRRSGFLHPLRTPSGRVVTNDFAPDHPHQHGVFFAWTNTAFRGKAMNFWDQLQKTARVESLPEFRAPTEERSAPSVSFALRHEDITAGEDRPATVLNERWVVTTYPRRSPYLVDLESIQVTASDDPLVINKYHYGGLGVRGNGVWSDPEAKGEDPPDPSRCGESEFLTSEGKTRADGNHTRPRWVDIHGEVDGAFAGLAVLQHPSNFRFPQPVRLHPNMPYFSVAPAVLGGFKIEPGTPYRSRYRLVIHDGKPDPRELDRLWNDYAEPPTVRVVEGDTP